MVLEDITQITIGVVLKRKEAKYPTVNTYKYEIFNLRSYEEGIEYEVFYSDENLENFIARKGDILFRLSFPMRVIEVDDELEGKLVNNQYCIIKMNSLFDITYDIDFIKWFLESDIANRRFEKMLIGTTIKSIPVSELRKLEIPDLNLDKQEQISKIVNTWDKQKKLYKKIIEQKEKYYDSIISKLINGGNE